MPPPMMPSPVATVIVPNCVVAVITVAVIETLLSKMIDGIVVVPLITVGLA